MIDYQFQNPELLQQALTHPSLHKNNKDLPYSYERMEFLGDKVLGMVIADIIFTKHYDVDEGSLSLIHAKLVNSKCVALVAEGLNIGGMLKMHYGEEAMGGRKNIKTLENAMEAVVAAVYLDSDYATTKKMISKWWGPYISQSYELNVRDSKSLLQEWAQQRHLPLPLYNIVAKTGPAHQPEFTIMVSIESIGNAEAVATSKKVAEIEAASKLLKIIKENYEQ